MALQNSGAISLQQIQDEFGGSHPISMSEYYRNGLHVYSNNGNVPTSGAIGLNNFYNGVGATVLSSVGTINGYGNRQQITVSSFIPSGGVLIIPSDMYVWSNSTGAYAMDYTFHAQLLTMVASSEKAATAGHTPQAVTTAVQQCALHQVV